MQDRQVRLWDLRTNICQGLLTVPGQQPCAAFDQQVLFLSYTVLCFAVVRPAMGPFTFHAAYLLCTALFACKLKCYIIDAIAHGVTDLL